MKGRGPTWNAKERRALLYAWISLTAFVIMVLVTIITDYKGIDAVAEASWHYAGYPLLFALGIALGVNLVHQEPEESEEDSKESKGD